MTVNVVEVKQKIMKYVLDKGPSLPVHLTKIAEMNLTFTSAILSELLQERKLKLSNLRIGTSPLYYIPGQEEKLESFISNLKEPEIEAFNKLKQNKILDDEKQNPVLRVALRSIRDFAIPIKNNEKIYWKYHLLSDEKASSAISEKDEPVQAVGTEQVIGQQIWEDIQKQQLSKENIQELVRKQVEEITNKLKLDSEKEQIKKVSQDIQQKKQFSENFKEPEEVSEIKHELQEKSKEFEQEELQEHSNKSETVEERFQDIGLANKTKPIKKTSTKKKPLKEIFLEEAKIKISLLNLEIIELLNYDANKLIAKVKESSEFLLIFTKKKRLEEKEILKDLKKYNSENLSVQIYLGSEPSKKITEKIEILGKIKKIKKIQEQ